jgi:hypothetical protein
MSNLLPCVERGRGTPCDFDDVLSFDIRLFPSAVIPLKAFENLLGSFWDFRRIYIGDE